jgi:hypothetical protein
VGGERAGPAVLPVDHLVIGAATVELMFAFSQTIDRSIHVKTHRSVGDIFQNQFLQQSAVGAMDGNRQRLRLNDEAHGTHLNLLFANDLATAEFFRDVKGHKRSARWNGPGLPLVINGSNHQLRRPFADFAQRKLAVDARPTDRKIGFGPGQESPGTKQPRPRQENWPG